MAKPILELVFAFFSVLGISMSQSPIGFWSMMGTAALVAGIFGLMWLDFKGFAETSAQ